MRDHLKQKPRQVLAGVGYALNDTNHLGDPGQGLLVLRARGLHVERMVSDVHVQQRTGHAVGLEKCVKLLNGGTVARYGAGAGAVKAGNDGAAGGEGVEAWLDGLGR